jgi:hypothetical protein
MFIAAQRVKILVALMIGLFLMGCSKKDHGKPPPPPPVASLVNYAHLDYLFTPVHFETGTEAAGIYIYAESPDYHLVADADEGFTCTDDVARAALVYLRSDSFAVKEDTRNKTYLLLTFLVEMQASNGYFYNFLLPGDLINKYHANSVAGVNWWSWRCFQALSEAAPLIRQTNPTLATRIDSVLQKIIANIKSDLATMAQSTKESNGFTVPQWLPLGSASDQAATLLLGLINYCSHNDDVVLEAYINTIADGIAMMQQGDAGHFPYGCFMSWENQWHAYGNEQAYALLKAGEFLNDDKYLEFAMKEIDGFYPWLFEKGFKKAITFNKENSTVNVLTEQQFDQIAYGITPMVLAAAEAYRITSDEKYAELAGRIAGWYAGANEAGLRMYSKDTGRCYDALTSTSSVNKNSGAESTIEALLCMQIVEKYPSIKAAFDNYSK